MEPQFPELEYFNNKKHSSPSTSLSPAQEEHQLYIMEPEFPVLKLFNIKKHSSPSKYNYTTLLISRRRQENQPVELRLKKSEYQLYKHGLNLPTLTPIPSYFNRAKFMNKT